MVIYCGSFSKTFSPAFRLGYVVASENVIKQLATIRILLDRQGDHILEEAMAHLLDDGTIQRYTRKALAIYHEKRDHFCATLRSELAESINFTTPDGGMAVWTEFDQTIDLQKLAKEALQKNLYFSAGKVHQYPNFQLNATRLGFASSSKEDLSTSLAILKKLINK